jgi:cyclase
LVAQANVPKLQFEAAQRAEASGKASDSSMVANQVYADTTFTDVWRKDVGSETISSEFRGPAHTGGDATVYFEKANVVHAGDLVFNRLYPVIDHAGGGSIKGWISVLDDVANAYPSDAIYIFGHGRASFGVVGKKDDLHRQKEFFLGLMDYTQKQIALGKAKPEIVALANLPGFDDWHDKLPNRLGLCLGAAYDELTAKTS